MNKDQLVYAGKGFLVSIALQASTGIPSEVTRAPRVGWVLPMEMAGTAYGGEAMEEAARARRVEEYPLSNERLLAYAARNPAPQAWYDEDEDLFA
jgi:hypothetical protein